MPTPIRRLFPATPFILALACAPAPPAPAPAPTPAPSAAPGAAAAPAVAAAPAAPQAWIQRSALYEVFVRDFSPSGDLNGVTAGLDRIAATGANVIWLMPIHPVGEKNRKGTLGSSYSVKDYLAVNPAYGDTADFRTLVDAAHARGLKVILDWVPNHTAWDNVWVRTHPEYYTHVNGEMTVAVDNEGKPTDWTDVADLDYSNPGLRSAMISAMKYWLETFGIDGYRMDVAGFVPDSFWREAIPQLRAAGADLLLAEWGDPNMHALGFDLTYDWDDYARLKRVWNEGQAAWTFADSAAIDQAKLPNGGMRMRFTTNHDETAWDAPPITLFDGAAGARAAYVAEALLPGPPLLYAGQEVESPQKLGLFEQQPVDWNEPGADSARAFYDRVVEISRTDDDFCCGDFAPLRTSAPDDVIAYRRGDDVVLVNARERPARVTVQGATVAGARDLLRGGTIAGDTVALPAYGALVLDGAGPTSD